MALTLDQLKSAFKKSENPVQYSTNIYPFWNMPENTQAIIRFLPDKNEDNPHGFLIKKHMHKLTINGEQRTVPCLKMYEDNCPICKVSAAYYKEGDKISGKKYWRSEQHIAQALIIEDPIVYENEEEKCLGKVKLITLNWQLFNIIKEACESGDLDEVPFAYEGGTDFIIKKTITKTADGDQAGYVIGTRFARKSSDLTPEQIEYVEENLIDLATTLPENPSLDKVEALLEADMTGSMYHDPNATSSEHTEKSKSDGGINFKKMSEKKKQTQDYDEDVLSFDEKPSAKTSSKPVVTEDEDDDDDYDAEAAAILARIKNRNQENKE
jgi:hypothetical protein